MARIPSTMYLLDGGGPDVPTTEQLAATLKSDIQASKTKSNDLLKEIAADKQAALDAKKAAETALIEATGAKTLAGAKIAAAKRDVSRNPAVVEANRALAAATAAANTARSQQYTGGGSAVDPNAAAN
jgi:predicted nucleotide-binding protein